MPSTSMGDQESNLDSKVEEVNYEMARFMASLVKRADGGRNDASFLEDENYNIYD
jgi:hypothetical protein